MTTPLLINIDEQASVEALKTDIRLTLSDGLSIDTDADGTGNTGYATKTLPVKNFSAYNPAGSETDATVADGLRGSMAPLVRRIGPVGFQVEQNGFSSSFTTSTVILSATLGAGSRLSAVRSMHASVNFSAQVSVAGTGLEYWIEVDGVATTHRTFMFNESSSHRSVSSSWIVTMPARSANLVLRAQRYTGTGLISLDPHDCATLTFWG